MWSIVAVLLVVMIVVGAMVARRRVWQQSRGLSREQQLRSARRALGQAARERRSRGRGSLRGQGGGEGTAGIYGGDGSGGSGLP